MSTDETIDVDGPRAAAEILSRLPRETRSRLVESIRTINAASAVKIESIIIQTLSSSTSGSPSLRISATAAALNKSAQTQLATSAESSSTTTHSLSALTELKDSKIQELLRDVAPRELAISLKNAPREAQEKLLYNISSSKQSAVLDELKQLPPMRLRDVEAAQARLLKNIEGLYSDDAEEPAQAPRRLRSRLA